MRCLWRISIHFCSNCLILCYILRLYMIPRQIWKSLDSWTKCCFFFVPNINTYRHIVFKKCISNGSFFSSLTLNYVNQTIIYTDTERYYEIHFKQTWTSWTAEISMPNIIISGNVVLSMISKGISLTYYVQPLAGSYVILATLFQHIFFPWKQDTYSTPNFLH